VRREVSQGGREAYRSVVFGRVGVPATLFDELLPGNGPGVTIVDANAFRGGSFELPGKEEEGNLAT